MAKRRPSTPQEPEDYEKLRAVWYQKLEDDGFDDIEQSDGNLKIWSVRATWRGGARTLDTIQSTETYYYLAEHFLEEYKFQNKFDQDVWRSHAAGEAIRSIVAAVNKHKRTDKNKTTRDEVWKTIKRLEQAMKRMYLPATMARAAETT